MRASRPTGDLFNLSQFTGQNAYCNCDFYGCPLKVALSLEITPISPVTAGSARAVLTPVRPPQQLIRVYFRLAFLPAREHRSAQTELSARDRLQRDSGCGIHDQDAVGLIDVAISIGLGRDHGCVAGKRGRDD